MKNSLAILSLGLFLGISSLCTAADWPQWRGPDQNGISKETGWSAKWPASGPKQLWKAQVGQGYSSFAVSSGRVYTTGNEKDQETIFCLDANTGVEIWKHTFDSKLDPKYYDGGTSATPTVDGERVFTINKRGLVQCLDAIKGGVIWSKNLPEELKIKIPEWGFAGSITVVGGNILLNVGTAGTMLDKLTGKVVWTSGTDVSGYSTPILFDANGERAALFMIKQDAVAVKTTDGKELWRAPWKVSYDVNAADPILTGGKLFVSAGYNRGGALFDVTATPAKQVWENKNMRNHFNPSVLLGGNLYGIDGDSTKTDSALRCVDFQTGEIKWTEKTGFGSVTAADGKLIVLTSKGELLVADASPANFKPISRTQALGGKCWTTPVLANGKIYCRNSAGQVICLDVSGK